MIYNFKQLGQDMRNKQGQKIKENKLVRSAYLEPNKQNEQFIEELHIDTIFDFRSQHEIEENPNFLNFDVAYYPIGKVANEQIMQANAIKFQVPNMVDFYGNNIYDCQYFKRAVLDVCNSPRPILFHCTAGKDRTGMFGITLMELLGFSKDDIVNHYLNLDQRFIEDSMSKFKSQFKQLTDEQLYDLLTVKEEYFNAFYNSVINEYGSFDNYFKQHLKLDEKQIANFRNYYLD